jgi:site-specific DNA-methyltransferase (adenine-specific)
MSVTTQLIQGDCLEEMGSIPDGSVDLILSDPPYGTTACSWDSIIPFEPMWAHLKRIIKPNGAIVMTASQPFTSALIMSNVKMFKYCWVWEKSLPVGFQGANRRPLKNHEDVCVFNAVLYNPVGLQPYGKLNKRSGVGEFSSNVNTQQYTQQYTNYPRSVLKIASQGNTTHPTQKPVALMKYLIKTYTNEDDTVLDFCMGSGTTGVACVKTDRNFIGIEKDPEYFKMASDRVEQAKLEPFQLDLI